MASTGQTANNIEEVISAAYYQRVDSLSVTVGLQQWELFDPDTNKVHLHLEQKTSDEDLMDFAAIHTLLNGGIVYAVEPQKVPGDTPLAAVFRY